MISEHNNIRVYKFGGASVNSAKAVKNVADIINQNYSGKPLIVVVSAMGKTTNALEGVVNNAVSGQNFDKQLTDILLFHQTIVAELFNDQNPVQLALEEFEANVKAHCNNKNKPAYNFLYDQVVSQGELLSTAIVGEYLKLSGLKVMLKDARELIKTDANYRAAKVDWNTTEYLIKKQINPLFHFSENTKNVILTQGFIASGSENKTTTLGREGSDFSAAILAYCIDANEVSIWKDVPGVLNADPKYFSKTQLLQQLSYKDAIELAYYGATIIHPKTIKPLQNKKIPLYVRSFLNPNNPCTCISEEEALGMLPSFIFKYNQLLITIHPKDFSFVVEDNLSFIFGLLVKYKIAVNLMQNSAISFQICVENDILKTSSFLDELKADYIVKTDADLELITIRHYNQGTIEKLMQNKTLLVEQKNSITIRLVVAAKKRK